jgi:hypothetical protein
MYVIARRRRCRCVGIDDDIMEGCDLPAAVLSNKNLFQPGG